MAVDDVDVAGVAPGGLARAGGRSSRRGATGGGSTALPRPPRTQLARGRIADEPAPLAAYSAREKLSQRHLGELGSPYQASRSANASFAHSTTWMYSAPSVRRREVEAVEERELLQRVPAPGSTGRDL